MQVVQLEKVLAASPPGSAVADGTVRIEPFARLPQPGLWTRLHQSAFHLPRPWSDERFRAEFKNLGNQEGWLWLAMGESAEQAIGAIGLQVDERDASLGHVRWLMVDPSARRRGIAAQLLAVAEMTAREHGIERLLAETASTWHEAIQFYEAHGFT